MSNKKPTSKARGAKSLSADKASQVKGGVATSSSATLRAADGSVKLNTGLRVKDFDYKP